MNYDLSPYSPPFRTKSNVVLTLYRYEFRKYMRKTITVQKKYRIMFQQLLQSIKEYYARNKRRKMCQKQQNLSLYQLQSDNNLIYQITVAYIESKTLKQYLLNQQLTLTPSIQLIQSLINSYINNISLNYIICSLSNIFVSKNWNNFIVFAHNSTSIAFILDFYSQSAINRCDFIEYINYLPYVQIQKYRSNSFKVKIRSLAINILSIILERSINFHINSFQGQIFIDRSQLLRVIKENKDNFDNLLQSNKIQQKIMNFSFKSQINFLKFFKAVILQQLPLIQQFNTWPKILDYFKIRDLSKFADQIDFIQFYEGEKPSSYSIFDVIEEKWDKQDHFLKRKFENLGIIKEPTKQSLLLYLIEKYGLCNMPKFSFQSTNKIYFPSFLKALLQIINQSLQIQQQKGNSTKKQYLFQAIQHISKQLNQITVDETNQQPHYFTINSGINLREFININPNSSTNY